jgi:hypothetical protein
VAVAVAHHKTVTQQVLAVQVVAVRVVELRLAQTAQQIQAVAAVAATLRGNLLQRVITAVQV